MPRLSLHAAGCAAAAGWQLPQELPQPLPDHFDIRVEQVLSLECVVLRERDPEDAKGLCDRSFAPAVDTSAIIPIHGPQASRHLQMQLPAGWVVEEAGVDLTTGNMVLKELSSLRPSLQQMLLRMG